MSSKKFLYFKNRHQWREWLKKNHNKKEEVWIAYYKKHTKKPTVSHDQAVEEALCFGWIDSKVKRIDGERFMQKYTPRKPDSIWSQINKTKAEKMIREGKMTPPGLVKIIEAKKRGKWQAAYTSKKKMSIPADLKKALIKNRQAWKNFNNFANTYQNMYIGWVIDARRQETRSQRIKEVLSRARKNIKPGVE